MLLLEIFEQLPKTEKTLLKHLNEYSFELHNDYGQPCEYRVLVNDVEIGMVKYSSGRKLACYELNSFNDRDEQGVM